MSILSSFGTMIKLDKFDQSRLINLSYMLNLKSLKKYDRARIIPTPKHTLCKHGRIIVFYLAEVRRSELRNFKLLLILA